MEPTLCYLQSQVVSACQSFRPVASFFFSGKSILFLAFFLIQKGVWLYKCAYDIPPVTQILNIYGFEDLMSPIQV